MTFDSSNRLSHVLGQETYQYDGLGRRVQTTDANSNVMLWIYSQSGQVMYTHDERREQNLAYIYLGNTQVATRSVDYVNGGAVSIRYQHTDALGSPVVETSAPNAQSVVSVLKRNSYAPYGEALAPTAIDGTGYTGHVMDQVTGLTYMQQRYYDSQIGRFLSSDPIDSEFNRYSYAGNSPYRFFDPDGRKKIDTFCGVGGCEAGSFSSGNSDSITTIAPTAQGGGGATTQGPMRAGMAAAGVLVADDATGIGVADDWLIPVVVVGAVVADQATRTYVTYTLTNAVGQTYVGRTSGFGNPQQIVATRFQSHHMRLLGFGNPTVDVAATGMLARLAIRGREQQLIDKLGGIGSPQVANVIRGVARVNPYGAGYHYMSNVHFGQVSPYTGYMPYLYPK